MQYFRLIQPFLQELGSKCPKTGNEILEKCLLNAFVNGYCLKYILGNLFGCFGIIRASFMLSHAFAPINLLSQTPKIPCGPSAGVSSLISQFLLIRFCATRWVENEEVAKRAIELWPNIVKVVKHWQSLSKSKRPKNASYETLVKHHLDKYVPLKMQFFQDVASHLKAFLKCFKLTIRWYLFLKNPCRRFSTATENGRQA